ncbi:hypothetical protein Poly41_24770 [Novipirellula artificiosorum]|uniref:Uncharacterized protein n=1 Tax=Novipirellula artificiosorum TaxID=2528016 RepID=A0A5C6DSL0_9BACT|nr:hypothetical protein Poly41_24770 [Novipirellula artificiosorum]
MGGYRGERSINKLRTTAFSLLHRLLRSPPPAGVDGYLNTALATALKLHDFQAGA